MLETVTHAWHPNTFGLLYGKTTKTGCCKRRLTPLLVKPELTDCPGCLATWAAYNAEMEAIKQVARELLALDAEEHYRMYGWRLP